MSRKFGVAAIPAGAPPSGFNLVQLGTTALTGPGIDNVDQAFGASLQRTLAEAMVFNGFAGTWERLRTPTIFKTSNVFAGGATTIWTPAAGKKFRLMGYRMSLPGDAACAAIQTLDLELRDGGAVITLRDAVQVPAAAGATPSLYVSPWVLLPGNGYLSSAANNVLAVNLGFAFTVSALRVTAVGTEE